MPRKWRAVHKVTGQTWKSPPNMKAQLVMTVNGKILILEEDFYLYMRPLPPDEWQLEWVNESV